MKKKRIKQLNLTMLIIITAWFLFGIYADLHRDTILGSLDLNAEEKMAQYGTLSQIFMIASILALIVLIVLIIARSAVKKSDKLA